MMTKVLWFSKYDMTKDQLDALVTKLGEIDVIKIDIIKPDKTIQNPFEFIAKIEDADVIAITPNNFQARLLELANGKPVIIAQSKHELVKNDDGSEPKVVFFEGWKQLKKIDVVLEDFA